MNLKSLFFTLALAGFVNITAVAQDSTNVDNSSTGYNDEDCGKYRSLYYQYLKNDMIRDACTFWGMAVTNCGDSLDGKFYKNGRVAYLKLLKTVDKENVEKRKEINDTLMWIYEQRMAIEKDADWELDYAVMLISNKSDDFDKIDKLFENIHVQKEKSSGTQIRMYFRHLIINRFNSAPTEEKEQWREKIIEEYIVLSDYCALAIKNAESIADEKKKAKKIKSYTAAQDFLEKYFLKIAKDCAVLTPVLDTKFETIAEGEGGMAELNKFIALMEKQKCTDTDTYEKYVLEANSRNPTAAGFFGLGNIYKNKGEKSKAVEAFEKALEMEGEGENKMAYTLELAKAQYTAGQYKSAFRTAKLVEGEGRGEAMAICGNCVAALANSCGESTFDRNANYWLANDYYKKAASLGAEVSSSKFLDRAPDSNAVFDAGQTMGGTITLSCWGESTTIR